MQIFQYPRTIFIVLIVSFLIFNSSIYSIPEYDKATNLNIMEGKECGKTTIVIPVINYLD